MKNKIPSLTVITLAVLALVGCGRQSEKQSPSPANMPGEQQTLNAINSSKAGAPLAVDWNNTNVPAATNWSNTNSPAATAR